MARTAPVPNIPPIPGMCPSVAVMGGGGSGGSGRGKGAGSGQGQAGAGAGDGGEQATPDQKNAAAGSGCGDGASSGCPTHNASVSRGHPVDVVTGRAYTDPEVDLFLPGPLPLEFLRAYSSGARDRDIGLGWGWSHSFAWEVEIHRRHITVWNGEGRAVEFPRLEPGEEAVGKEGWLLRRDPGGFVLDAGDELRRRFAEDAAAGDRLPLTAVEDHNKNRIALTYERGRLSEIVDSAGRRVRLAPAPGGSRVGAVEVLNAVAQGSWVRMASYEYSDAGDLVAVTDADGHTTAYAYHDEHLLAEHRDPTGLAFHFRYDSQGRCVETWGDHGGRPDPSLADDVPELLADHLTPARGVLHCKLEFGDEGYSEVVDSVQIQRFFGNRFGTLDKAVSGGAVTTSAYDDHGHVIAITDPLGHTTTFDRDERGRVLRMTDALGRVTTFDHDEHGRVVEVITPDGCSHRAWYDTSGNVTGAADGSGAVTSYRYDERGQLVEEVAPNGARAAMRRDLHGNVVELTQPNGGAWRFEYDFLGRRTAAVDPSGARRRFVYSPRGDLLEEHHPNGGVSRYSYDGAGNVVAAIDPDGRTWRYTWGGHHVLCSITGPGGGALRFLHNREGWTTRAINEEGEVHRFEHDSRGNVVREVTFDGRELRFRHDALSRRVAHVNGLNQRTEYAHDPAGQLVERRFDDGTAETFSYDQAGRLVAAESGACRITLEYDAAGNLVKETQTVDGETHAVEIAFDPSGARVSRRTSLGHTEEVQRDGMGNRVRSLLDGADELTHALDVLGQERRRSLPRGGHIDSELDAMGWLTARRVSSKAAALLPASAEPAWIGPRPPGATLAVSFAYSPAGELLQRWDQARGGARYDHDPEGQVLAALPDRARALLHRYDLRGNAYEADAGAPARAYGPGSRLLRRGATTYQWDGDGRLVERRTPQPEGPDEVWRYTWNAKGLLASVTAPDGSVAEFLYDPLNRRQLKRVSRPASPGAPPALAASTRFVWDTDELVHEIRTSAEDQGDPVVEERTYCFEDDDFSPAAHRTARRTARGRDEGAWLYYVNDAAGAPVALVDATGAVVADVERSFWGKPAPGAPTPIGFQGQYHDDETGLAYNRHRYYDPDVGRYISPDPIGLEGSFNPYTYGLNPLTWLDPFGLTHYATGAAKTKRGTKRKKDFNSQQEGPEYKALCKKNKVDPDESGGLQRQLCHTEQKCCQWAKDKVGKSGGELEITGAQLPPCNNCKGCMNDFAVENNANVNYKYSGPKGKGTWSTDPKKGAAAKKRREARKKKK